MNRTVLSALFAAITLVPALADVNVKFKETPTDGKIRVSHILISDFGKPRSELNAAVVKNTYQLKDNSVAFPCDPVGAARFDISVGDEEVSFFAAPGENIVVDVTSLNPLVYTIKGTELVEGMQRMSDLTAPLEKKIYELRNDNEADKTAIEEIINSYYNIFKDFIAANPNSVATPYAAIGLEGEDLLNAVDNLSQSARTSIIMPIVTMQYKATQKRLEMKRQRDKLASGDVDAPAFTLKNPEGKDVSISDFKGRWVILDFWGTWCPWCIKGFPALKDAYDRYAGKLEIIGIDCRDTPEKWKSGIEKYQLPWVQVYNPADNPAVTDAYMVQAFPTKVIVNPEGKIVNITVGEDPAFFDTLAKLIGR